MAGKKLDYWEDLYLHNNGADLPWFLESLDPDIERTISETGLNSGEVLDIGCGSGTQAKALAQMGFKITATDIAESAIEHARSLTKRNDINFKVDNILQSNLSQKFTMVIDRGCFHVLPPEKRSIYTSKVSELLQKGGHFLLKCFSSEEPGNEGPYRLSKKEIRSIFAAEFKLVLIEDSIYHGNKKPAPKALFCHFQKL